MRTSVFLFRPAVGVRETFHSIDVLRGLAAISILVFHYFHFTMGHGAVALPAERLDEVPLLRGLRWIRDHGSLAVQLFWVISGFVFMNVYAGHEPTARTFFVNRLARLYPLHLLTLLLVAAIQAASLGMSGHFLIYEANSVGNFILNLFFASAWLDAGHLSFNGPVWSISVEVLVYFLFWAYVRLCRPSLFSAGAAFLIFFALSAVTHNMVMLCGAFFFAGSSAYALFMLVPAEARGKALLAAAAFFLPWSVALLSGHVDRLPLTIRLLGLFVPALLVLALSEVMGLRSLYRRFRVVGDVTYSTYMWHTPLQMIFLLGAGLGLYPIAVVLSNGFFLAYLLFVILFAYASYRLIERPAQAWVRGRLLRTRRPLRAIAAP